MTSDWPWEGPFEPKKCGGLSGQILIIKQDLGLLTLKFWPFKNVAALNANYKMI